MLTNEQRKCFGLSLIEDSWKKIEVKPSPYDKFKTYIYVDNFKIVKCITIGEKEYCEYALNEDISTDYTLLLKKTEKGKDVKLSSSAIFKRTQIGMVLYFYYGDITLYSQDNKKDYYNTVNEDINLENINDFFDWVRNWEKETSIADIEDVNFFAREKTKYVKYKEGDVFVFKINRREYGYGRIILDYNKMRKEKQPFWDILMGTALVASVYHIVTDNPNLKIEEIKNLKSLPSEIIADNVFYYNEYKIIGNIPVTENEDYPIMYGRSISAQDPRKTTILQFGKYYKCLYDTVPLYEGFKNNMIGFRFHIQCDLLKKCIELDSNEPYWSSEKWFLQGDLRNPKHKNKLDKIMTQFDIKINEKEY